MTIGLWRRGGLPFSRCFSLYDTRLPRSSYASDIFQPALYKSSHPCCHGSQLPSTGHRTFHTSSSLKLEQRRVKPADLAKPMTDRLSATATRPLGISRQDGPSSSFIDTPEKLARIIDSLTGLPSNPPSLYLDLEGVNLSRFGTISILQILVSPLNHAYIIDVHTLREKAFFTSSASGQTLKAILESDSIPKAFFDVRADSDALYSNCGISLRGVRDIQVMEFATRKSKSPYLNGMARCIERDLELSAPEQAQWASVKARGKLLFSPQRGGSYEVFNHRPLSPELMDYCTQDVQYMPNLLRFYSSKLSRGLAERVDVETKKRIAMSQTPNFVSKGPHMSRGPLNFQLGVSGKDNMRIKEDDTVPKENGARPRTPKPVSGGFQGQPNSLLAVLSQSRLFSAFRRLCRSPFGDAK